MRCIRVGILCVLSWSVRPLFAQSYDIAPMHFAAGNVLTFYSQNRLNPSPVNPLDVLPKGTLMRIKLLDEIDSSTQTDGAPFRGILEGPLADGHNAALTEEHAEVRGLLVLLRSRTHPEGFRYELLLTGVNVHGKMQELTATLNPSLFDTVKSVSIAKPHEEAGPRESLPNVQPASSGNSAP